MEERRAGGAPVTRTEFEELKAEVKKNTELTLDIHAMVRSFKIVGAVAKWVTLVSAAGTAAYHGVQAVIRH